MLTPLSLASSCGFGDRLGLAIPGHIAAVRGTNFAPIFAQQSVRENERTRRTLQQVITYAMRAVNAVGWDLPWGADADHLKTVEDIFPFVEAAYTFFTCGNPEDLFGATLWLISPASGFVTGTSRVVISGDVFQTVVVNTGPQSVALTLPVNATGLFGLDQQPEMLLPFEGLGVDTTWEFRMLKAANLFDYGSIADVLVTVDQ